MLHLVFIVAIVAGFAGCGASGEPGSAPARHPPLDAAATSSAAPPPTAATAAASASAGPEPPLPEGTRYASALACEGVGHFDLTALVRDPKCGLVNADPRLRGWTRSIPAEAGPFAVRLMDAGTPLRVQKQGVIEIRLEIENLGGDTDLIQADEDATPRIVALSSFASSAPVGDLLRPRPTGWNGWTGVRWKSHAVGELRVPMEARVFKGLAHLAGPGDVRPYVRVEEWLEPGAYALRVEALSHVGEAPPVGPLGTLVVAP